MWVAVSYERGTPVFQRGSDPVQVPLVGPMVGPVRYTKSMSLKYEPASEPLHISAGAGGRPDGGPGACTATWEREFKIPWREAGPPNHYDDKVDSDQ